MADFNPPPAVESEESPAKKAKRKAAPVDDPSDPSGWHGRVLEFEIPRNTIGRFVRQEVGEDGVQFERHAKSALARAGGLFVYYLTCASMDVAKKSNRQTPTSEDIFAALEELGFDTYIAAMKESLIEHRSAKKTKSTSSSAPTRTAISHSQPSVDYSDSSIDASSAAYPFFQNWSPYAPFPSLMSMNPAAAMSIGIPPQQYQQVPHQMQPPQMQTQPPIIGDIPDQSQRLPREEETS